LKGLAGLAERYEVGVQGVNERREHIAKPMHTTKPRYRNGQTMKMAW
jgi:hypothetical protein